MPVRVTVFKIYRQKMCHFRVSGRPHENGFISEGSLLIKSGDKDINDSLLVVSRKSFTQYFAESYDYVSQDHYFYTFHSKPLQNQHLKLLG